jgi:hypothetical protein
MKKPSPAAKKAAAVKTAPAKKKAAKSKELTVIAKKPKKGSTTAELLLSMNTLIQASGS